MKKAQMQMMESTLVLLVFFILLAIGGIFFVGYQKSKAKEKDMELLGLTMIKKSQTLNYLPELYCSEDNVIKPDCYDMIKLEQLKQITNQTDYRLYYLSMLGNINLTIKRFDPDTNTWDKEWNIYDNPSGSGYRSMQMPVSIYNATTDDYYFGIVNLWVYT